MGLIEEFIARYGREFDETARLVNKHSIRTSKPRAWSMVTSRAKSPSRLEPEARVRQRARSKTYATLEDISADIVDLAGARVVLYFPGERDQVDRLVRQLFVLLEPPKEFPASSKPKEALPRILGNALPRPIEGIVPWDGATTVLGGARGGTSRSVLLHVRPVSRVAEAYAEFAERGSVDLVERGVMRIAQIPA